MSYTTLAGGAGAEFLHEIEIKRSRFITRLVRAETEAAARAAIEVVRREHWSATHNCTAIMIGAGDQALKRSSDDGEPSGTAGVPMLEALSGRGAGDLVAIVTRYYGGIQLGAGGLVRAYGGAVLDTLDAAANADALVTRASRTLFTCEARHADAGRLESELRHLPTEIGFVTGVEYASRVRFTLALGSAADEPRLAAALAAVSKGAATLTPAGAEWVDGSFGGF
ncbi:YigZ family protein [Micrococcales bacterium 31B]|nr:YigZ family protein [Micrococcales bacterium 31B]